jgi:DNA-binding Lrp family transcriptional regulator
MSQHNRIANINLLMDSIVIPKPPRRPRFRRAAAPAFRVTEDDITIVHQIARHRFLRSAHVAALVGRSPSRTNYRLSRLFHAGYVDRPRAQLDYYPTSGSAPMVYALGNAGAKLLSERRGVEFAHVASGRKNQSAGRPFIEHQLEIADFYVALHVAARGRSDIRLMHADELESAFPEQTKVLHNPLALPVGITHNGKTCELELIPDLAFGLLSPDGKRRCFMVEIDRGTMPIRRSDIRQTSFDRKMRTYLAAHAAQQHEQRFGWKTFRVLTVTSDRQRARSLIDALREIESPPAPGPELFFFALRDELRATDPMSHVWRTGTGREVRLL